jgi:hypothetical protein
VQQIIDIDASCQAFAQSHDGNVDTDSGLGIDGCHHFSPWAESLLPTGRLTDEDRAYLALTSSSPDPQILKCLRLLEASDIPAVWIGAIEAMSTCVGRAPVAWAAVQALYGEVAQRMRSPLADREVEIALAHLVEATTLLEGWVVRVTESYNYVPMGFVQGWWPDYLERVNASMTPEDLRALSETAGGVSETEAMSAVTPPERLAEIYQLSRTIGASANPRLPAATVNESMAGDWDLLFHPNADPERSWTIIQQALENGDGEWLSEHMGTFHSMRDNNWATWAEFAIDGPHAALLRGRIAAWCEENLEDEDERFELMDTLGIDFEE